MTAANAFWRVYIILSCCFMLAFPIVYIGAEAEKSAAEAKAANKEKSASPQTSSVVPTPTEGYATVAFDWLKSPSSLWGWMRAIETMLVPGIIYLGFMLIDVTRAHLKRMAGS